MYLMTLKQSIGMMFSEVVDFLNSHSNLIKVSNSKVICSNLMFLIF